MTGRSSRHTEYLAKQARAEIALYEAAGGASLQRPNWSTFSKQAICRPLEMPFLRYHGECTRLVCTLGVQAWDADVHRLHVIDQARYAALWARLGV